MSQNYFFFYKLFSFLHLYVVKTLLDPTWYYHLMSEGTFFTTFGLPYTEPHQL